LLLLDEFNSVAAELGGNDQAALRAALAGQETGRFSMIIAVSHSPEEMLEFIPNDIGSQLAGVINVALPPLGGLAPAEAAELARAGRTIHNLEPDTDAERWLTGRVGTHPLLLQAACYAWYATVQEKTLGELTVQEIVDAEEAVRQAARMQWNHVAPTLGGDARAYLRHGTPDVMPDGVRIQNRWIASCRQSTTSIPVRC
jgi:hypothetical protein